MEARPVGSWLVPISASLMFTPKLAFALRGGTKCMSEQHYLVFDGKRRTRSATDTPDWMDCLQSLPAHPSLPPALMRELRLHTSRAHHALVGVLWTCMYHCGTRPAAQGSRYAQRCIPEEPPSIALEARVCATIHACWQGHGGTPGAQESTPCLHVQPAVALCPRHPPPPVYLPVVVPPAVHMSMHRVFVGWKHCCQQ